MSYATYLYMCKIFGLYAADEHSTLTVDQLPMHSEYMGSSCYSEENHRNLTREDSTANQGKIKSIKHYAPPENSRCVNLFRTYLSYIPNSGPFYRRPLKSKNGEIKFSAQKLGVHTLQGYSKQMTDLAGINGYHTGHSGKVTHATTLFRQNFDEQLIAKRTGHSSLAIRSYKRTSDEQT
uniref:Uncharacterized protein LOC102804116 n=1 Tax=Saccoglossus kowalevskii TaxID=10224 RepID=A0ABM0LYN3_SACKO|nr:PREDICTED: uncharacterized protein LOC102804116 [Saccoglossus kowalevskii]